jgi:N-acetylglucosaminyldiphosphoundecaprenol N-acetyl-beta-D-mannosaminyltransferase
LTPQTEINSITVNLIKYVELIEEIKHAIERKDKLTIGYLNAHIFNLANSDKLLKNNLKKFNIIHPDGIGIYLAFKFLKKDNGILKRFTGSDFYNHFEQFLVKNKIKTYFFGNTDRTLKNIPQKTNSINISGFHNGYDFNTDNIIEEINSTNTEVVVVGLGSPLQENWIINNKDKIQSNVVIAVGEGIKVFARTKIRGPLFLRLIGLEWFVRFLTNPLKYFSRYIIGIPLFLITVIKLKLSNN